MKNLFLIRHAKSSWEDMSLDDWERPLNKRGLRDAPFMAKLLAGKGISADLIISSYATRALTTATYFAEAFNISREDIQIERKIYEAAEEDLMEVIQEIDPKHQTVLIFGHNPTMTHLANMFSDSYIANVPTCGICKLKANIEDWSDFDTTHAHLTNFWYPKQYF